MAALISLILALVGVPLFAVMGLASIISHKQADIDLLAIIISFYELSTTPLLQALPLFAFGGYMLAHSRAPDRLMRLSNAVLGWLPGGLAIVAVIAASILTALTGASGVTIVALGGLLLPVLQQQRYEEKFSLGVITTGGSLGLLFAPSLPIILYGVVSQTNTEHLFRGGFLPGCMIIIALSLYCCFRGWRDNVPRRDFDWGELWRSLWAAKWELPLPVIIVVGIYRGFFAISEAAVVATAYILLVEIVITRDIRLRQVGRIARESMGLIGGILIILGITMAVNNVIIDAEVPEKIFERISPYMVNKYAFLVALNAFLLVVGCMIDIYAAIVLVVPLIYPIAMAFGINDVHLGIIFLTNLGIGYATPPVGINLFIASIRFNQPVLKLYWACIPFILLLLVLLGIITFVPKLTLLLVAE